MEKNNLSVFLYVLTLFMAIKASPSPTSSLHIERGFTANLDQSSRPFQPLLVDPSGVFSLCFLQVNSSQLDLAVVHLPSGQPTWRAAPALLAPWSSSTSLTFNGSLLLSDQEKGILWSTTTAAAGDRLRLLNSSNLQIVKLAEPISILWQTFDFPSDTIVQGQNFTSAAALFSSSRRFSMSLGRDYLALFMEFSQGVEKAMYWKRKAMQAKNQIVASDGPIYGRVEPIGFLGLYQKEGAPVDVLPFDSFNRGILRLRRLTLEDDGDLRGYFWNGTIWVSDFAAIAELCDLPSACGAYGLCQPEKQQCGCVEDRPEGCLPPDSGDFCRSEGGFRVIRRKEVDLANKEVLGFYKMQNLEDCEASCERNCSCWGAVYNNATGYCYRMDYPVQTVVRVGDERRTGYFKVRNQAAGNGGGGGRKGRKTAQALLVVGMAVVAAGAVIGVYRLYWRGRRRGVGADGSTAEVLAPGPYKDLHSSSFGSIELANSFRK